MTGNPILGETGISFTPTSNGTFGVEIFDGSCTTMSMCLTIEGIGFTEKSNSYIRVYPNPSTGSYLIDLGAEYAEVKMDVTSVTGQVMLQKNYFNTQKLEIDLDAKPGIYILALHFGNGEDHNIRLFKK